MSTTPMACLVVGVPLSNKDVIKEVQKRDCEHDFVSDSAKFCSVCGAKKFVIVRKDLIGTGWDNYLHADGAGGFELTYINESEFILGTAYKVKGWCNYEKIVINDEVVEEVKEQLKKFMEPLGLWNESSYGIYLVSKYF